MVCVIPAFNILNNRKLLIKTVIQTKTSATSITRYTYNSVFGAFLSLINR